MDAKFQRASLQKGRVTHSPKGRNISSFSEGNNGFFFDITILVKDWLGVLSVMT
jgi:hypothetical protein